MDRGNILSGGSFRATLYGAVVFLLVLTTCGALAISFIERQLLSEVRSQFAATIAALQTETDDGTAESFVEEIRDISRIFDRIDRLAVLIDPAGNRIVGHHDIDPDIDGWTVRSVAPVHDSAMAREFYLTSVPLGDHTLIVGRDMAFIRHFEAVTVRAFLAVGATMTLVLIGIGYTISRRSQIKLEAMGNTLEHVAEGDTDARIDVSPNNDQIDRIARVMNRHLDSLSDLLRSTKSSAVAIAHDLKRPLARASLGLERTLDGDLTETARTHVEDARDELGRLNAIFTAILRIARIDAAQGQPLSESVDLRDLVTDLAETYEVVAEESGQTLVVDMEPTQPLLLAGDSGMIAQMIVNLLQNAITHCPPGTFITLAAHHAAGSVSLVVADNGPGVPEAERARLVEAFFRGDAARSTEGNGLGMALVKSIADRHGATLTLQDNDPGLRVTIVFPA